MQTLRAAPVAGGRPAQLCLQLPAPPAALHPPRLSADAPAGGPSIVQGVANRDLKLENLLLDRPTSGIDGDWPLLKICDFGEHQFQKFHTLG